MPEKLISTDPPQPRPDDFEEYLATDDLFVDFFNRFLELPSFPEPHRFNPLTGGFEVLSPAKNQLAEKIKSISRAQRPKSSVYKNAIANPPIRLPHYEEEEEEEKGVGEEIKTSFNVKCLDKEQGFHWMKKHRLSQFLRSDLYIEYRLAKLLSQIETSKAGMKLTISPTYRPWYKPEPEREPEEVIDDTADMIKLLQASVGSMTTTQTKEWFTIAKQLEESTTSSTGNSRPTSSLSSFRTETTTKSDKLKLSHRKEGNIETATTDRFKSSVTFASTLSESDKDDKDEIARFMPQPIKSSTQMGHVIKIEPVLSDDESDQGVGSECDDVKEDFEKSQATSSSVESLRSDEKKVDDMANKIVLFTIERAINSLSSSTQDQPISSQDANTNQQDKPLTHLSMSSSKISTNDTKISSLGRKTIAFKILDEPLEDEADSVFSDETDELGSVSSFKFEEFISVKEFCKFRAFLKKTVGDKLMRLWMDIDRTRFSIANHKMGSFLQRMRETYLKVGSMNRLPNEILKKHNLIHATQWTLKHLHNVQKDIVEPLLLYWAPRFLMSQMTTSAKEPELSKGFPARSRLFRPTSSQSYPSPKTITILPLRPKSCLPRIKQGQRPSTKLGHVVSEYHQFTEPSIYLEPHKTPNPLTTPSPIPDYLQPKVMSLVEEANSLKLMLPRRPATAGPLTRQTKARLERKKSAAAKSRAPTIVRMPLTHPSPPASVSSDSTVRGSPAMESMLQALYHDTRAGWFFTQFCEKSKNSSWSNAVHFWFDVQQYHYLFYQEIIDQFIIEKKSKMIYSTYIVNRAHEDIGVSPHIRNQIRSMINPPYDELFDAAEEHALKLLIIPWNKMLGLDRESYNRVELIEEERRLAVAAKYQACLQKKGILKKRRSVMPDFEAEKKHVDDLWSKVPEEFQSFTFDDLIRNRIELEYFRKFLEQNYVKTDLMCWLDIETFKRINHHAAAKRDEKAKEIREKYLNKKYFFGPTSPATKEEQNEAVKAGGGWGKTLKERPPTQLIVEAQVYVRKRIETRWLPLFLASKEYQDRQHPHSQMSDAAEDVVLQKKKKRGEPWKMLDNRWQSSLRDLMEFRRALCNPVTAAQFRRYASMRGEFLENDVLFWLEVQKYKDFCHIHNDSSAIESKVTSIINCFIHSHIPPSLQIDISHEMAEKLVEKRRDLGPYVFREAQLTVFRVLFPHWNSFCEFRKTLSDDKLTAKLERQKKKKLERMKQQLKEQEKEEARREELRASREAEVFDLPDVGSLKGSDLGENLFAVPRTQVLWSYGKYVEGLDRQRMLLLMENEVKGRVPLEALPDPDYNVASDDSDAESGSDDAKSTGSTDKTKKKRKKEKIIHSTVKTPPASDVTSVQNITNKKVMTSNQEIKSRNQDKNRKSDSAAPAVVVD